MPSRIRSASRIPPCIDCDPVIELPGTIAYTNDEDELDAADAQELAKIKAAKKTRIEAAANAYLRGDQPFILTAGLNGPFDGSWRNPWSAASKKRKRSSLVACEDTAVERARKLLRSTDDLSAPASWRDHPATPKRHVPNDDPFQKPTLPSPRQLTPQEKVQSWLRRNSQPLHGAVPEAPQSPTAQKVQSNPGHVPDLRNNRTPTRQFIAVSSQDVHAPIYQVDSRVFDSFNTIVHNDNAPQNANNTHSRLQGALHDDSREIDDEAIDMAPAIHDTLFGPNEDVSRAEAAIRRIRRESSVSGYQIRPSSPQADIPGECPSMDSSHKESITSAVVRDEQKPPAAATVEISVDPKEVETSVDEQRQTGSENRQMQVDAAVEEPTNMAAPSEAKSTNLPPSAQIRPELHVSTSNISSANMIFLPPPPSATVRTAASEDVEQNLDRPTSTTSQGQGQDLCKTGVLMTKSASSTFRASTLNTTTVHSQRVGKTGRGRLRGSKERKDKNASFANGPLSPPPAESIKNALRVQKVTKSILKNKSSDSVSSKSIVKIPSQIDSSRARVVSGQDGLVQGRDEEFDIEEALDDMGSFLSTWDVERGGVRT